MKTLVLALMLMAGMAFAQDVPALSANGVAVAVGVNMNQQNVPAVTGFVAGFKAVDADQKVWVGGRATFTGATITPVAETWYKAATVGPVALFGAGAVGVSTSNQATGLSLGAGIAAVTGGKKLFGLDTHAFVSAKATKSNDGVHNGVYADVSAGVLWKF